MRTRSGPRRAARNEGGNAVGDFVGPTLVNREHTAVQRERAGRRAEATRVDIYDDERRVGGGERRLNHVICIKSGVRFRYRPCDVEIARDGSVPEYSQSSVHTHPRGALHREEDFVGRRQRLGAHGQLQGTAWMIWRLIILNSELAVYNICYIIGYNMCNLAYNFINDVIR